MEQWVWLSRVLCSVHPSHDIGNGNLPLPLPPPYCKVAMEVLDPTGASEKANDMNKSYFLSKVTAMLLVDIIQDLI
jgi:hypothetical protein